MNVVSFFVIMDGDFADGDYDNDDLEGDYDNDELCCIVYQMGFFIETKDFLMFVQSSRISASDTIYTTKGPLTVTGFLLLSGSPGSDFRFFALFVVCSHKPVEKSTLFLSSS